VGTCPVRRIRYSGSQQTDSSSACSEIGIGEGFSVRASATHSDGFGRCQPGQIARRGPSKRSCKYRALVVKTESPGRQPIRQAMRALLSPKDPSPRSQRVGLNQAGNKPFSTSKQNFRFGILTVCTLWPLKGSSVVFSLCRKKGNPQDHRSLGHTNWAGKRSPVARDIVSGLKEAAAFARGEIWLPVRVVNVTDRWTYAHALTWRAGKQPG